MVYSPADPTGLFPSAGPSCARTATHWDENCTCYGRCGIRKCKRRDQCKFERGLFGKEKKCVRTRVGLKEGCSCHGQCRILFRPCAPVFNGKELCKWKVTMEPFGMPSKIVCDRTPSEPQIKCECDGVCQQTLCTEDDDCEWELTTPMNGGVDLSGAYDDAKQHALEETGMKDVDHERGAEGSKLVACIQTAQARREKKSCACSLKREGHHTAIGAGCDLPKLRKRFQCDMSHSVGVKS